MGGLKSLTVRFDSSCYTSKPLEKQNILLAVSFNQKIVLFLVFLFFHYNKYKHFMCKMSTLIWNNIIILKSQYFNCTLYVYMERNIYIYEPTSRCQQILPVFRAFLLVCNLIAQIYISTPPPYSPPYITY